MLDHAWALAVAGSEIHTPPARASPMAMRDGAMAGTLGDFVPTSDKRHRDTDGRRRQEKEFYFIPLTHTRVSTIA